MVTGGLDRRLGALPIDFSVFARSPNLLVALGRSLDPANLLLVAKRVERLDEAGNVARVDDE